MSHPMFRVGSSISHKSGFPCTAMIKTVKSHHKPNDPACLFKVSDNGKHAVCIFVGTFCECEALMQAL